MGAVIDSVTSSCLHILTGAGLTDEFLFATAASGAAISSAIAHYSYIIPNKSEAVAPGNATRIISYLMNKIILPVVMGSAVVSGSMLACRAISCKSRSCNAKWGIVPTSNRILTCVREILFQGDIVNVLSIISFLVALLAYRLRSKNLENIKWLKYVWYNKFFQMFKNRDVSSI